jgi:hypothetical protein
MLPFLNRKHHRNIGEALEDAVINGQPDTNIDTGGTHFGKTNPLVVGETDARDMWAGFRRFTAQFTAGTTRIDNAGAIPTVVKLRGLRTAMGEYGVDPGMVAYVLGIYGYMRLLDDTNVQTIDKFGPSATVHTGALAKVDGADVIVSRRIAENMTDAALIDGVTTTRTQLFCVNTDGAILGNRRRITLGQQHHLSSDSTELVAFWRGDFQPVYPVATVPAFAEMYDVLGN